MAPSESVIVNPRTGQRTVFLQTAGDTNGAVLRMETFHAAHSPAEPEHVHPLQESSCQVLTGSLRFCINGKEQSVGPGEIVHIPPGTPHYFWNAANDEAHAIQEFRPALNIEDFFVTYFALARDEKLNDAGLPNILQLAVLMREYDQAIRVTKPPRFIQQIIMRALEPVGRLFGYRGSHM